MKRKTLAQVAAESNEVYGRWRVEGQIEGSTRRVSARCLDCDTVYEVDLYHLRRTDRTSARCRRCNNVQIAVSNRLGSGEHLARLQFREYRKSCEKRGYEWNLAEEVFRALLFGNCFYCGSEPNRIVESSWDSILVNGVDRVDNSLGYSSDNTVSCCKNCNYAKRDMSAEEFISLCKRVAEKCE